MHCVVEKTSFCETKELSCPSGVFGVIVLPQHVGCFFYSQLPLKQLFLKEFSRCICCRHSSLESNIVAFSSSFDLSPCQHPCCEWLAQCQPFFQFLDLFWAGGQCWSTPFLLALNKTSGSHCPGRHLPVIKALNQCQSAISHPPGGLFS